MHRFTNRVSVRVSFWVRARGFGGSGLGEGMGVG